MESFSTGKGQLSTNLGITFPVGEKTIKKKMEIFDYKEKNGNLWLQREKWKSSQNT